MTSSVHGCRPAAPAAGRDRGLQVLFYHGAMERFLNPQSGEPTNDLARLPWPGDSPALISPRTYWRSS